MKKSLNTLDSLLSRAEAHFNDQLPFVLYRKPTENIITAIFQSTDEIVETTHFTEQGFVFAPLRWNERKILLRPDSIEKVGLKTQRTVDKTGEIITSGNKSSYSSLFKKAQRQIEIGKLKKVVLSRKIEAPLSQSSFEMFERMTAKYANAFCYLWYHPRVGQWLGATPELLIRAGQGEVKTVSLAGTKEVTHGNQPQWTEKELEEQEIVTNFTHECFKKLLSDVKISGPESIMAGNLWHLSSQIRGKTKPDFKLKDLLFQLHPTPAVCGTPKQEAFNFIVSEEGYDREYYTGFLGELNFTPEEETHLFVNLRCLQIKDEKAIIYVGGGITSKSNMEQEWVETQNKSRTMLELL